MMDSGINPAWVLVGLAIKHVSEFSDLAPADRPVVRCPYCKAEVVLKLGQERVHHFAHKPDAADAVRCRLDNPHAAQHFNALNHLAKQLDPATCRSLRIVSPRDEPEVFAHDWDQVRMEYPIGSRRADLALLRAGQPIALIEVYASHEVDLDKNDDLDALGIPWIEVDIVDLGMPTAVGEPDIEWSAERPLNVRQGTPYNRGDGPSWRARDREPQSSARVPHDHAFVRHQACAYIAAQLENRRQLRLTEPELPWKDGSTWIFAEGWDTVDIGKHVQQLRVDLTLSRNGVDIGYLMIYAGEPMWELPRRILEQSGVPWVEIDAKASLWPTGDIEVEPVWAPEQPLIIRPALPLVRAAGSAAFPDPETAAVQLARFEATRAHLVAQLQNASALAIALPSSPEHEIAPRVIAHDWDDVAVDYFADGVTIPVALVRRGNPILFIEIRTRYRLEHARLEGLERQGVPWIEVAADDILGRDGPAWVSTHRIPIRAGSPIRERNQHPRAGRDWSRWPDFEFRWLAGDFDEHASRRSR